jgi:hypothetical protein
LCCIRRLELTVAIASVETKCSMMWSPSTLRPAMQGGSTSGCSS